MDLFKLVGSIFVKSDEANEEIDKVKKKAKDLANTVGKSMENAGTKITSIGKAIAPVSVAIGGALVASTKGASDFQNAMAKMSTLFDTTQVDVSKLSKEFLGLSNETGKSATELAEAGYQALSASVPIEKLGNFTRTATNLAKVGFTQASTAVDVLTTAINAYGLSADDANKISNNLVKTQNLGKTTVDELASSMGKIIPTASSMNVNLDNLSAVYVSLTKQGIATAEATTYANSMFNELGDSGTAVGKILKEKTGQSFQELMTSGMSVADVLKILQDDAKASGTNFNELWGSAEAGKSAIALLNGGVDEFNGTVETMANNTDVVSEGLKKLETPSVKIEKALNRVKNSGIELGTSFITALTPAINKVCDVVESVTNWFNGLDEKTKTVIATTMAVIAIASPLLMVIGKIISHVGTLVTNLPNLISNVKKVGSGFSKLFGVLKAHPIAIIITAIVALVGYLIYLWNTNEDFRNKVIEIWNNVKDTISNIVNAVVTFLSNAWNTIKTTVETVFNGIKDFFQTVWETIKNIVQVALMFIVEIIKGYFTLITLPFQMIWVNCKDIIMTVWNAIKSFISTVLNAVKTTITNVLNAIKTVFSNIWNAIKNIIITPVFNSIKSTVTNVMNAIKSFISTVLNAIKSVFSTIWNAIKSVVTSVLNSIKSVINSVLNAVKSVVSSVLNSVKSTFSSVWNGIKSVVSGAINSVKSSISSGLNSASSTVGNVLNNIKSKFSSIWNSCKSVVSSAISSIKSVMNFSWSLPKLKLPHPKVSGKFSLNPPSVPNFSIAWYKHGGIMTEPTLFDYNPMTGKARVGGEAGDEAIAPIDLLQGYVTTAVASQNNTIVDALNDLFERLFAMLGKYFPEFTKQVVLDTGVLVGELAPALDVEFGKIMTHRGRGI